MVDPTSPVEHGEPAELPAVPPALNSQSTPSADMSEIEPIDDRRYIRIRRSHFYAALMPIAFAAGLAYGYFLWGGDRTELVGAQGSYSAEVNRVQVDPDDDPSLGPADAPVTIIEFSDFSCPYCRAWNQQVFHQLLDHYADQIRFVYRDFPIVGGGSVGQQAAQAANCAAEQDRYWDYHDALFSGTYPLDPRGYLAAAESLGMDAPTLGDCLDSGRHADESQADLRYAAGVGVSGTPTFFINGIPLVGAQPLSRFIEIIDAELGR